MSDWSSDVCSSDLDADMAWKEDEVAARERRRIDVLVGAERGQLKVAVAGQLHPRRAPDKLDEARAVDALGGASAPKIGRADHLLRQFGGVFVFARDFGERGARQIAVRSREPLHRQSVG